MCLKEQSKRHLKTIIWRFSTLFKRDKISVIYAIAFPIMFTVVSIAFGGVLNKLPTDSMTAVTDYFVTSSEYTGAASQFQPDPDAFSFT